MARKKKDQPKRLTVAELEALLNKENSWDDDRAIRILPSGEITYAERDDDAAKILTFREQLGGEYAGHPAN